MDTIKERLEDIDAFIVVGVGGDSGTGKTTLSNGIRRLLGDDLVSGFSLDDYHKEDRETRRKTGHLPLDPKFNHLDLLAEHLAELRRGKEIIKPVYNHNTGRFDPQVLFTPKRVTIVEGLHPFYTEELRRQIDFSIFVNPVQEVKWKWKLQRDVEKRGHDKEDAFKEILTREPLFKLHIDIQKIYSEVVINILPSRYSDDKLDNPQVSLIMRAAELPVHHIDISLDLANFISGTRKYFLLEFGTDYYYGNRCNILTIDGQVEKGSLYSLQKRICSFTGTDCAEIFDSSDNYVNSSGIAQLIVTWRFLEKLHMILSDLENRI